MELKLDHEIEKLETILRSKGYDTSFLNEINVQVALSFAFYHRSLLPDKTGFAKLTGHKDKQMVNRHYLEHHFGIAINGDGIKIKDLDIIVKKKDGKIKLTRSVQLESVHDLPTLQKTRSIAKMLTKIINKQGF